MLRLCWTMARKFQCIGRFCALAVLISGTILFTSKFMNINQNNYRALFTTTLHNKEKNRVLLPGISSEMLQTLLVYVYLRKLDLNDENVYSILIAADYLSILGALELCSQFLESIFKPTNCISILEFARSHFCQELAANCWKYIMKNFTQVAAQSNEILNLSLKELQEIINADDLNVKSEETVWETILR